ncbi:hypothetical protein PTKIN_Ptkin13bG0207200 [Pterospermum kingtungense]
MNEEPNQIVPTVLFAWKSSDMGIVVSFFLTANTSTINFCIDQWLVKVRHCPLCCGSVHGLEPRTTTHQIVVNT